MVEPSVLILTPNEDRAGKALNPAIANGSAYAETYLKHGKDGRPDLKGRFYWMGLAAFASKQVKCGLDFIPSEPYLTLFTPLPAQPALRIAKNSLGKGNFWLFQDIYVWHWFYRKFPEQFDECAPTRNATQCDGRMQRNVDILPWAQEALQVLNGLQLTDFLRAGFKAIKEFETTTDKERQRGAQLESLLRIADHEQRKILQPLIYNDPYFQAALRLQAGTEWITFMPQRVAAFSTACDVEDPELRVRMEEGNLFDEDDRMKFITAIAEKYHSLMEEKK